MAIQLKEIIKSLGESTSLVDDEQSSAEFTGYIDTGSYIMNAVLSGSLYGGMPNNKVTVFAGETTTGKTFFTLGIIKSFLDADDKACVLFFDTEAAVTKDMMVQRGLDPKRVIVSEPITVQEFRTKALNFVKSYMEIAESKRPPFMLVLDSLGILSTNKEMADSEAGSDTKDMTRAGLIRGTFRTIRLKLAKARVPMIVTNHVYSGMSQQHSLPEMSGGGGAKYAGDCIAFLSKRKERDGDEVIGNVIHVRMYKSRASKENKRVDVLLTYDKGLDRYYGLADLAIKYGIFEKKARGVLLPNGKTAFIKNINAHPEEYYTEEVMTLLEEAAQKEFLYGGGGVGDLAEGAGESDEA